MGSVDVVGLKPHGEMSFREISPSWTLDGQSVEKEVAAQDWIFWKFFTSQPASADTLHDAFQSVS